MTTSNLLVELFVEELPPKALQKLGDAFAGVLREQLAAQGLAAANSRTSWVIFIEQNLGPHMLQKCATLAASFGKVSSWYSCAVSGSSPRLN